ncbi:hypothetical protein TIFTF001_013966 [Ficus carica]|uniref:Uncharacterized protein n=1 Tax=Ficus carica TaxID=3494 RepID=A0AA87ZYP1_FICCA|nr:hypothetical protein TIFTF001_013966 [Ficus carica]
MVLYGTVASAEQEARTPDYLSDVSDIPISKRLGAPTGHAREGTQRLRQILQMGPITCLDRSFMDELNGVRAPVQPSRVVDLTEEEDATTVRMAGHPRKYGCEEAPDKGFESSRSATPPGEPIQSRQRGRSCPAGVPEIEHCSHAVERRCLSDLEKLLCSLGKVFMRRLVVQHVAKPIPDEDNFLVDRVILLPMLPGNVFRWLPRLGQELQAPMVLLDGLAKYKWFGSSSTSGFPHDQSRSVRSEGEVIIMAPIPDPAVHYCARIVVAVDSSGSSPGTWDPRIANEDVEEVIRQLYPGQHGTKRPSDQERTARLQQKFSKGGDGSKTCPGGQGSGTVSGVSSDPPAARVGHTREKQPASTEQPVGSRRQDVRPRDPPATVTGAEPIKRKLLAQKVVVAKFDDRLTSEVAKSSQHSNHIRANEDMIDKLVDPLQPYGRQSGRAGLVAEVKKWREVEKLASEKVSKPRSKRTRLRRRERGSKAVTDYENSLRFKARLLTKYKEGMKDMKVGDDDGAVVGEMVGGAQVANDVVVVEEPKTTADLQEKFSSLWYLDPRNYMVCRSRLGWVDLLGYLMWLA